MGGRGRREGDSREKGEDGIREGEERGGRIQGRKDGGGVR